MIDSSSKLFLQALNASLQGRTVNWDFEMRPEDWIALFEMADIHHVLPMIYEAVYKCLAARNADRQYFQMFKRRIVQSVMLQAVRTKEFLQLFQQLTEAGVTPCVVKGIICRNLYSKPDYRMSGDEDVLIPAEQFRLCHEVLLANGMYVWGDDRELDTDYEVPYRKQNSTLYIELHKSLFPPDSDAYGEFNRFFEGVTDRMVAIPIDGIPVSTLEYTDHLFYLICHAFKHFLHSGFGIRQVCDIVLFANAYGNRIDWLRILENCRQIHGELFTAALFRIGQKYLVFDPELACYPEEWRRIQIDEKPLLEDLLASGIYGSASRSRIHSSNITLNAVSAQNRGKRTGSGVLKSVFPSARQLESRYPYLKQKPYLLPVAWVSRIVKYRKETGTGRNNHAVQSVRIGNQRIELMKKYGILEK